MYSEQTTRDRRQETTTMGERRNNDAIDIDVDVVMWVAARLEESGIGTTGSNAA